MGPLSLRRRQFLAGLFGSCFSKFEVGSAFADVACNPMLKSEAQVKAALDGIPIVDIHCHIFNAADIPIDQYFEKVYLFNEAIDEIVRDEGAESLYDLTENQWAEAHDEIRGRLRAILDRWGSAIDVLSKSRPRDLLALVPGFAEERALLRGFSKGSVPSLADVERGFFDEMLTHRDKNDSVLKYLRDWVLFTGGGQPPESAYKRGSKTINKATAERRKINVAVGSHSGLLAQLNGPERFLWGLTSTRLENFLRLRVAYRAKVGGAVLKPSMFTPAMVDFDCWLDGPVVPQSPPFHSERHPSLLKPRAKDDEAALEATPEHKDLPWWRQTVVTRHRTKVAEQVELMKLISLRFPGEMHAFVAFCPWREAHHKFVAKSRRAENIGPSPLAIVRNAIEENGCVGVKLYPPMGYRPYNNAAIESGEGIRFPTFPAHLYDGRFEYAGPRPRRPGQLSEWKARLGVTFGGMLDDALKELYRYCESNNVPIMAHAAPTNSAGGYDFRSGDQVQHNLFSEKGSPEYWQSVLIKWEYRKLRLNLAHSGFGKGGWPKFIRSCIRSGEHVYADLSYFERVLLASRNGDCEDAEVVKATIEGSHGANPDRDPEYYGRRFMYGSDWFMMSKEAHFEKFFEVIVKIVATSHSDGDKRRALLRNILAGNAARFLGLDLKQGPSTYVRLKSFYERELGKGSDSAKLATGRLDRLSEIASEG